MWPLMTHSSPSSTAVVSSSVGSEPAFSGSVIENAERRSPASSGYRYCSFWSSVPAIARISELPESGAALPNTDGANGGRAEDLVHQAELDLAEALAAEVGRQVRGPQPALLDLLLERRDHALEAVLAQLLEDASRSARPPRARTRASSRAAPGTRVPSRSPTPSLNRLLSASVCCRSKVGRNHPQLPHRAAVGQSMKPIAAARRRCSPSPSPPPRRPRRSAWRSSPRRSPPTPTAT